MIKQELTSNIRYRTQTRWFRKPTLVLQVEIHEYGDDLDNGGGRVTIVPVERTFFRDATTEDISAETLDN